MYLDRIGLEYCIELERALGLGGEIDFDDENITGLRVAHSSLEL